MTASPRTSARTDSTARAAERAAELRRLHHDPAILVLVNAWDVASARAVAEVPGCRAVATASAAIAACHGCPDGEHIPADLMLDAVERIAAAVDLPVTADLEAGYGDVDRTIRRAVRAGVAGANLEDGMRPTAESAERVATAVRAGAAEGVPLVLNARTDCYLRGDGRPAADLLADATARGLAYLEAGADCVFVPGCTDEEAVAALAERFGPGRLSLLGTPGAPSPERLAELGAARVSYGPFPHRRMLGALAEEAAALLGGDDGEGPTGG
ncbi:isocitrate lyase/phosphoenolpyruvate mutase family protein [Streptomyces sp. DSM 42041]|uniref:Isocitrate lyase/phosphoenolpyruvate mutase family protein n=1 Tax=Streptomyces hazeniae TaxID=3075538 RepID=A0ABU2NYA5_9ACTN|nr:isocitrate lyase/phosphoenolpyruvate mutase family protein [Streptomyces sp. DSM 42041]MDT0381965.1 isocitrate lyase/phosphoenolpyruvate mutase family protein [Streptomyces sp. DSM 42041]